MHILYSPPTLKNNYDVLYVYMCVLCRGFDESLEEKDFMLSLLIEGGRIWRSVSIERGHRSREKRVKVADCAKDSSDVLEILKSSVGNCMMFRC